MHTNNVVPKKIQNVISKVCIRTLNSLATLLSISEKKLRPCDQDARRHFEYVDYWQHKDLRGKPIPENGTALMLLRSQSMVNC